jgi:hypothetical protein
LLGESSADPERHGPSRRGRPSSLRPGFFQRLWQTLHADPRRLPYAWLPRDGRLVCRLLPLTTEQEHWVESECVADRPDVELRIVSPPRQPPQLAEVVFPGSMTVPQAKEYIFRELQELPVQAAGPGLLWDEGETRVVLHLGNDAPDAVVVPLEKGVTERVVPPGSGGPWRTSRLEFDRAEGWDRARAEAWVEKHLKLRSLGRTAPLAAVHRMRPTLAWLAADLLHEDYPGLPAAHTETDDEVAVEFVAVPGMGGGEPRRRGEAEGRLRGGGTATVAPRQRQSRGGAGLEMDLADRRIDSLPAELRAGLPAQGLVNYLEAQAVVRTLEALAADPAFLARTVAWERRVPVCDHSGTGCDGHGPAHAHRPALAVVALYPAQVELIRRLITRSPALASFGPALEVGLPSAFRQRECLAALVSLTRSHTHRAVTYGEGPHALTLALTRAAERLVLFGDPGTLARRAQWGGPLDHLDETAAARERAVASRLVQYIHDPETPSRAFRLREGSSV